MSVSRSLLITDFATSTQPNYRKGGLIGLAATAVGLAQMDSNEYLKKLVPPVLGPKERRCR